MAKENRDALAPLPSQAKPSTTDGGSPLEPAIAVGQAADQQAADRDDLVKLAEWLDGGGRTFNSSTGFLPPLAGAYQQAMAERGKKLRAIIGRMPTPK